MSIVLPALAMSFVALAVWLMVRIVNRRGRWVKRAAWALVSTSPVLYVLSFGPACWINERSGVGTDALAVLYHPIFRLASHDRYIRNLVEKYADLGSRECLIISDGRPSWCPKEWAAIVRLIESIEPDSNTRWNINSLEEVP